MYSLFVVIIFVYLFRFLKIGIRALSLADIVGKYFYFCSFFFGEEKRGLRHSRNVCVSDISCLGIRHTQVCILHRKHLSISRNNPILQQQVKQASGQSFVFSSRRTILKANRQLESYRGDKRNTVSHWISGSCIEVNPECAEKENRSFLKIRNSCMQELRSTISRLDQNHLSAGTRVKRSCRVGDRGTESPMHMKTGIAISRYAISRRS